jgi:hypothetical protein
VNTANAGQQDLLVAFRDRAAAAGIDPEGLFAEAKEIIVFGSRAARVNCDTSDLDVVCVTRGKRKIKTPELDCLCLPPDEWTGPYWRGCELGSHIAEFGVWIKGGDEWRHDTRISDAAINRKERRVRSLIGSVHRVWPAFHTLFRLKYAVTVRRELQRLALLQDRAPIPPTPILDLRWQTGAQQAYELLDVAPVARHCDFARFLVKLLRSAGSPFQA